MALSGLLVFFLRARMLAFVLCQLRGRPLFLTNTVIVFFGGYDLQTRRDRDPKQMTENRPHSSAHPHSPYPHLYGVFERQARATPDAVAVEFVEEGIVLTYAQLEQQVAQLASLLLEQGVCPGQIVALYLPRGVEPYIGLLAILRAGGAYLPIDTEFPEERVRFMLEDAQPLLTLTRETLWGAAFSSASTGLFFETLELSNVPEENPPTFPQPQLDDRCYIIYTSGTTGAPKGVCLSQGNALAFVRGLEEVYDVKPDDRVLQGFSLSFDASVEEVWMAFSSGAALIVGTKATMQDIDELPRRLSEFGITVWSTIPTLLSVVEPDGLPQLNFVLMGGEATRADIIERWAASGRRLFNGYGPTECSVVTTYDWCVPGKAVTIGRPLPGYEVMILGEGDGGLVALSEGEEGELCVAGPGVSVEGYLGRPELNEEKFVFFGGRRVYRTGDLASLNEEGDIVYCGRIDTQVKLRGYRIELEEIEAVLVQQPGCEGALVSVVESETGLKQLVAYLLQESVGDFDLAASSEELRQRLPAYMMPSRYVLLAPGQVPRLTSGKVDRRRLPDPGELKALNMQVAEVAPGDSVPENIAEEKLMVLWQKILQHPVGRRDSFFALGGNSVSAAQVITLCREDRMLEHLSIRDLYEQETLEKLAQKVDLSRLMQADEGHVEVSVERVSEGTYRVVAGAQLLFLGCLITLGGGVALGVFYVYYRTWLAMTSVMSSLTAVWVSVLLFLLVLPVVGVVSAVGLGLFAKRVFVGRYVEEDLPVWGWGFFRWWVGHILTGPLRAVAGAFLATPLAPFFYRLLGAKIGKGVYLGSGLDEPDLVSVGDGATISTGAQLRTHFIEDGVLKLRHVDVGAGAYVGTRAVICGGARLGDDCVLHGLSCLKAGVVTPTGTEWLGSPAVLSEVGSTEVSRILRRHGEEAGPDDFWESWGACVRITSRQYGLSYLAGLIRLLPFFSCLGLVLSVDVLFQAVTTFQMSIVLPMVLVFATYQFFFSLFLTIAMKHLLVGKLEAGTWGINSKAYVRRWFCGNLMATLVSSAGNRGVVETMLMPYLCRWLGSRVGPKSEISDLQGWLPDLLSFGEGVMVADQCHFEHTIIHRGRMTLAPIEVGSRTFIGNSSHLPPNTRLADDCLLGILALAPESCAPGTSWLGSPPMRLPRRIQWDAPEHLTTRPPLRLIWLRGFFNFWKMVLPWALSGLLLWLTLGLIIFIWRGWGLVMCFVLAPALSVLLMGVTALVPVLFKWLLMGRYRAGQRYLWSVWMWRCDLAYEIESHMMAGVSGFMMGNVLSPWWNRLMGARMGRRPFLMGGNLTEFDLIEIGDHFCHEGLLLTHLFEDRVMKLGPVKVGDACHVGGGSMVLYDSELKDYTALGDLSLVMKNEAFPPHSQYQGLPAEPDRHTTPNPKP